MLLSPPREKKGREFFQEKSPIYLPNEIIFSIMSFHSDEEKVFNQKDLETFKDKKRVNWFHEKSLKPDVLN